MSEKLTPLRITDTTLRDAHQSLLATRLRTDDMLPIAPKIDRVGFHSVEVWGGATFDACMRFLNEDPWERLRQLKAAMPNTPFQMLLRGQNLVGYRHYPDDIVERFIVKARENGIDIFRIFDALNDVRNMLWAMKVAKREGGHVQAAICYTTSPIHHLRTFVRLATELEELGADSICIKDMAGLITPQVAFELVARIKYAVKIPVQFHTHFTSGMATAACINAAEAGADVVDAAISSMALGTSQPPIETLVGVFEGTQRDTGLDLDLLMEIAAYFATVRQRYAHFEGRDKGVDVSVLRYQIPGGMISNLMTQLREQNALDRYQEVLSEVPRVRADLGYPPLVTPSSQIVGTQATLNVLLGERYKAIIEEVKAYLKGLYGRPPGPVNEDLRRKAIGDEEPITCRPADLLEPGYEKAKQEIGELAQSEEDVLSYALFPQVGRDFLERRARGVRLEDEAVAAIAAVLARQEGWVAKQSDAPAWAAFSPWKLQGRPVGRWGGWIRW
ncbi:MAG: pyruvate/oxaloacetate carboxyltransferase [Anaerolineae bacterium]|jgi:oxaloacetate decarboxylase alpha subunit|nr:pyruvate/oxaloacetate carboxyltransferase [Anaerolineae bacterium]MDH7472463.1 pyruvate/oxaloacetate carboxyltransferase [Anaerolineae bacterium]